MGNKFSRNPRKRKQSYHSVPLDDYSVISSNSNSNVPFVALEETIQHTIIDDALAHENYHNIIAKLTSECLTFTIKQINPRPLPNYSTIFQCSGLKDIISYRDQTKFATRLYETFPMLDGLDTDGILFAGGAICDMFCQVDPVHDMEVYFYGEGLNIVNEHRKRALTHIIKWLRDNDSKYIVITKNHTTNLYYWLVKDGLLPRKIQFNHILYLDVGACLCDFDIACEAIGFTGKQLHWSTMGKFAHTYHINILNHFCASQPVCKRLDVYNQHGFTVAIPWTSDKKIGKILNKFKDDTREAFSDLSLIINVLFNKKNGLIKNKARIDVDNVVMPNITNDIALPEWCHDIFTSIVSDNKTYFYSNESGISQFIGTVAGHNAMRQFDAMTIQQLTKIYGIKTGTAIAAASQSKILLCRAFIDHLNPFSQELIKYIDKNNHKLFNTVPWIIKKSGRSQTPNDKIFKKLHVKQPFKIFLRHSDDVTRIQERIADNEVNELVSFIY